MSSTQQSISKKSQSAHKTHDQYTPVEQFHKEYDQYRNFLVNGRPRQQSLELKEEAESVHKHEHVLDGKGSKQSNSGGQKL
ncbi:hypothetical protein MMC15_004725 [Xylographa vitiligo]|nr:hypothetical protein [Xylographa vitiligo]